ncbi:MAG: hypothetical protein ACTS43_00850 [Candidatus Hodgkinia cicadicola]
MIASALNEVYKFVYLRSEERSSLLTAVLTKRLNVLRVDLSWALSLSNNVNETDLIVG